MRCGWLSLRSGFWILERSIEDGDEVLGVGTVVDKKLFSHICMVILHVRNCGIALQCEPVLLSLTPP